MQLQILLTRGQEASGSWTRLLQMLALGTKEAIHWPIRKNLSKGREQMCCTAGTILYHLEAKRDMEPSGRFHLFVYTQGLQEYHRQAYIAEVNCTPQRRNLHPMGNRNTLGAAAQWRRSVLLLLLYTCMEAT